MKVLPGHNVNGLSIQAIMKKFKAVENLTTTALSKKSLKICLLVIPIATVLGGVVYKHASTEINTKNNKEQIINLREHVDKKTDNMKKELDDTKDRLIKLEARATFDKEYIHELKDEVKELKKQLVEVEKSQAVDKATSQMRENF